MGRTIYLVLILLQAMCLTVSAEAEEPTYSNVIIDGTLPINGDEITATNQNTVYIVFTGTATIDTEKSCIIAYKDAEPVQFEHITTVGTEDYFWYLTIPKDILAASTEEIKLRVYAYDNEQRVIRGNMGEYTELTYKCYLGVPEITVSPAEGYVDAIEDFSFSFSNGIKVNTDNEMPITLYGSDKSTVIETFTAEDITGSEEPSNELTITPESSVSQTGTYWLYIPNGFFLLGEDETRSKYKWVEYTIEDISHKYGVTLDPINGSEVSSLSDIKITFDNESRAVPYYRNPKKVSVIDSDGTIVTEATIPVDDNENDNQCMITLKTPVSTPGKYKLYIPKGTFHFGEILDRSCEDMYFDYTVKGIVEEEINVTVTPSEGDVEALERIDLKFPDISSAMPVKEGDVCVILQSADGTEAAKGGIWRSTFRNWLYIQLNRKVMEQGTYTLLIPAGSIELENKEYEKDMTFTFSIVMPTGIGNITNTQKGEFRIYNLTGRKLEKINAPGVYIINGKKYIKRK